MNDKEAVLGSSSYYIKKQMQQLSTGKHSLVTKKQASHASKSSMNGGNPMLPMERVSE